MKKKKATMNKVFFQIILMGSILGIADGMVFKPIAGTPMILEYDTSGTGAVPKVDSISIVGTLIDSSPNGISDYVDLCENAFKVSYHYIIDSLGYSLGPSNVHINMDSLGGIFGFTSSPESIGITNSFPFLDLDSVRLEHYYNTTAAYLLFLAVQLGYTRDFNFFNASSATWMENKIFPAANLYLDNLFANDTFGGYHNLFFNSNQAISYFANIPNNEDRVVIPMFLDERYSEVVNKNVWEELGSRGAPSNVGEGISLLEAAVQNFDPTATVFDILSGLASWTFFAGSRSGHGKTFSDGHLFPTLHTDTIDRNYPLEAVVKLEPFSFQYFNISGNTASKNNLLQIQTKATNNPPLLFHGLHLDASNTLLDTLVYLSAEPTFVLGGEANFVGLINPTDSAYEVGLWFTKGNALGKRTPVNKGRSILSISPNPLNAFTRIFFNLAFPSDVTISILNLNGRLIKRLRSAEAARAGEISVKWDGTDLNNRRAAAGVYFVRVNYGNRLLIRTIHLI